MIRSQKQSEGVSEVVGEMLMIGLVVILVSVFASILFNFLPADRDPVVAIRMSNDRQNITLWHKGGDWVKAGDLTVRLGNDTWQYPGSYTYNRTYTDPATQFSLMHPDDQAKEVFDLGSNITIRYARGFEGNESVRLVTSHAVIYSGRVTL